MAKKLSQSRERLAQTLQAHRDRLREARPSLRGFEAPELIDQRPTKRHRPWHFVFIAAAAALIVGIGLAAFMSRASIAPVTMAGIPVGNSTSQEMLEQQLTNKLADYKVTLQYDNGTTQEFTPEQMGITVDVAASAANARAAKKPDNYLKRLRWWHQTDTPLVTKTDSAALEAFLQDKGTQKEKAAVDATIGIDAGKVVVTPAQTGEGFTLTNGSQALVHTVDHLQTTPLQLTRQELKPAITEEDAAHTAAKVKEILAQKVSFTINGQTVTARPADIGSWIELTPSPANHTVDYSVNSGKVLTYMNSLAKQYIQPPVTQITMPASAGGGVVVAGRNGVDITNKESTAAEVASSLMSNKPVNLTLPVQFANFQTITAEPRDKWIVVNTTTKRMYAYEQSTLVRSFLVSAGAPQTPTVTGQYNIYAKFPVQDMRGANADGSRYFQPAVKWVMYFYRDYAIHGNYWRPTSYFGNINSSHGCVGVLDADAKWLYDWAPMGTTVIVHR